MLDEAAAWPQVEDERAVGETYNVSSLLDLTEAAWIRRIGDVLGWTGDVVPMPAEQLPEYLRTPHDYTQDFVVDSSKLRRDLGYAEVTDEDEGLAATVAWERDNLPIALFVDYAAEDEAMRSER